MRKTSLLLLLILTTSCSQGKDEITDVRNALNEKYPNMPILGIQKLNDSFFEINIDDQLYYLTSDYKHLIAGNIIDFQTGLNLTENSLEKKRRDYISKINNKDLITYSPKKVNHSVTIFTDTSCPYCQKMHNEVKKLVANNIEVNYILFSRNEEDEDAYNEMVSVWCSDNQIKSLDMVFNNSSITAKTCDNPIKNNYIKARDLRVNGTPMIFTENGLVVPGYVSSDKLIEILEKSAN